MEILKKFLSRKFIAFVVTFILGVLAVVFNDAEWVKIAGMAFAASASLIYMLVEGWVDGKALEAPILIPTVATAVNDLVQVYEDEFGDSDITNFIQDLTVLVTKHFVEPMPVIEPIPTEETPQV